jgi:nucleoside-diphosphate-sugar epimerase
VARTAAAAGEGWARLTGTQPPFTVKAIRGSLMPVRDDGSKARALRFEPRIRLTEGMEHVAAWLREEGAAYLRPARE